MIKNWGRHLIINGLICLGKYDKESFVLMYHDINENSDLTPESFEYQLNYYIEHGYKFVSEVEDLKISKRILVTFDDVYYSFENIVFPILNKYNIPCILFVPTGYMGKKLKDGISLLEKQNKNIISLESLKKISKSSLITIGCHTHSHFNMLKESHEFIRKDIRKSLSIIESITNKRCKHFSFPQGKYNAEVVNLIRELDFEYAFTDQNRSFSYRKGMFQIPRYSGEYFLNNLLFLRLSMNSNCNVYMKLFA